MTILGDNPTATRSEKDDYERIVWDGRVHAYRPKADWKDRVSSRTAFYSEIDTELDPVTAEVLRNRLWSINIAQGETITRISGSPVFQALDFNMSILTEDGEIVMSAPFMQHLNTGAPLLVRYIMEKYSESPGIDEGDMFLASDPWIGASHQMDICLACPIFIDGELFAWVSNAGHQYDMGGTVPGGWPQSAVDVYHDPVMFAPFKFVERGVMRTDLEQMYRRQSRMPDLVALDLRAQLAGCRFAARSIQETCEEFGAPTVRAAMRRILDQAQEAFAKKLSRIPDGTWQEVRYFDEQLPGDRMTHRTQVNVRKSGDRLIVDNLGTDPQGAGPNGFTYMNFAGAFLGVLAVTMLHEHTFSLGGAERQIDFEPRPGLMTCLDYPAAVSGGVAGILTQMLGLNNIVARMMACDPELSRDGFAGAFEFPTLLMVGSDDRGNAFGTAMMDPVAGGSGARSYKDGIDSSGPPWCPQIRMPNVEATEQFYPLLYLFRKETEDSGGAGRWRGGSGITYGITPYRAAAMEAITNSAGQAISTHCGMGVFGGYPSPAAWYEVLRSTNVQELFANRMLPRGIDDFETTERFKLRGKSNGTPFRPGDVIVATGPGGGGFGDPLEREPDRVMRDVVLGYTSDTAAREVYGVVLDEAGAVDEAGTTSQRNAIRSERAGWKPATALGGTEPLPMTTPANGEGRRQVHECVVATDDAGRRVLACARCDEVLSDYRDNYKLGLLVDEGSVKLIPTAGDPAVFLDEDMVFRRFCCPNCQVLMTTEIVRRTEPILIEMMFA